MSRKSYAIFIFVLLFTPLAFGTVEGWSVAVLEGLTIAAFLIFMLGASKKGASVYEVPGIVPLACLWAYHILQLVPLPASFVKLISPETYKLHAETLGIITPVTWLSLSVQKKATLVEFFRLGAFGMFYILTVQLLAKREYLKRTVTVVIVFSAILAFFSILQHLFSNHKIYWLREVPTGAGPFGPFINRSHYAGFMGMIFPVALGIFLALKPRARYESFRDRVADILKRSGTNAHILTGFGAVLVATSVFLTLSRGGIISLCLSMVFFGALLAVGKKNRGKGFIIMAFFVLIVLSVGWFGWEPIFKRFGEIKDIQGNISNLRMTFWSDSFPMLKHFPLTGTGFGSFISVYPRYRSFSDERVVDHAHNDYLELLADGGIIAFMLAGWFLLEVFYKSYKSFLRRGESYSYYLFIGSFSGIAAILFHSFTDFNLHVAANGLYFFFLAGLMVSAANTRLREHLDHTYLKPLPVRRVRLLLIPLTILLPATLIFNAGILAGEVSFSLIKKVRVDGPVDENKFLAVKETADRASLFDPLEAKYRYAAGNAESALLRREAAMEYYRAAISLDPLNGEYLQRMGLMYSGAKDYVTAEKLLRAGIESEATNPERYRTYVLWLLSQGRKEEAVRYTRTSLAVSPHKTVEYITAMVLYGMSDEEVRQAMPERVEPHLAFGDYLLNTGKEEAAGYAYSNALDFLDREKEISRSYFFKVYGYYTRKGLFDEALEVLQKAKTYLPGDAGVHVEAGAAYEKLGMPHRAAEEYKRAIILDPGRHEAHRRLDVLSGK